MKKIQSWKTFNELKRTTYFSAAKKAEEHGDKKLSDKFKSHSNFIDEIEYKKRMDILEKRFSSIEPFKFTFTDNKNVEHNLTGKYLGIDPGMMWDVYKDNEDTAISISILFKMEEEQELDIRQIIRDTSLKMLHQDTDNLKEKISYFMPFMIHYSGEVIEIDGPYNVEESFLSDYISEGESPILFNNRKDANRLISILKSDAIDEIEEMKIRYVKEDELEDYKGMVNFYEESVDKLNPRKLYR